MSHVVKKCPLKPQNIQCGKRAWGEKSSVAQEMHFSNGLEKYYTQDDAIQNLDGTRV